jgi:hypothetical protein
MRRGNLTIPLTAALWALFAGALTVARFGSLPGGPYESLGALIGFGLLGAIAGWRLAARARRSADRRERVGAVVGHVLLAPAGYVFGILGPLLLEVAPLPRWPAPVIDLVLFPPVIAIVGVLPVLAGQALGALLGRLVTRSTAPTTDG